MPANYINERIGKLVKKGANILCKDHKPNFHDKQQSRLLNPSKTELGLLLKTLLKNINFKIEKDSWYIIWENPLMQYNDLV